MNIKWNADNYSKNFSFVHQYGNDVAGLLELTDDMAVLDLGCGNGALTKKLSERCSKVIGMDASNEMLEIARCSYPGLPFIQADATSFQLDEPVDAVFSNAVLHWIDCDKQLEMLKCVYNALKKDGQFVFEFGGHGNCDLIHSTLKIFLNERGIAYTIPNYFPTIGEYAPLLEQIGFKVVHMTLFDRLTELKGDGIADWIRMFVKKPFEEMSENDKENIISQVAENLKDKLCKDGIWYADYVRIRGKAVKC